LIANPPGARFRRRGVFEATGAAQQGDDLYFL
jgi:hypothetical protein